MIKKNTYKTYLSVIKNSVGSKLFRNFWVSENDKEFDAMENGELSCAFYVSGVLRIFGLIKKIHGTVKSTVLDLEKSGWKNISKPRIGSVLVWEKQNFGDEEHSHIGFYIGRNQAISNSAERGFPIRHNWQFNGNRRIVAIYWKETR